MTKKPLITPFMVLRAALILDFLISVLLGENEIYIKCFWIAGYFALHLNDLFRVYYLKQKKNLYFLSLFVAILGATYFYKDFNNAAVTIYFFFPLIESITGYTRIRYSAIAVHFIAYAAILYGEPQTRVLTSIIIYVFVFLIAYLFRCNNQEKKKIQVLNAELQEANARLQEYSENVEKISIMEERGRIAQELHDSIGHGLVALGMNLEFAENVLDSNPQKAREAVRRAHGQSKKCLEDLRCAVTTLKSSPAEARMGLRTSLKQLFNNISSGGVQIQFVFDDRAEYAEAEVKDCAYRGIREAVTNGIRHGGADAFTVDVSLNSGLLTVKIADNGRGCAEIVKSHGLTGMENRANALGGTVFYACGSPDGFVVTMELPLKAGRKAEDYD